MSKNFHKRPGQVGSTCSITNTLLGVVENGKMCLSDDFADEDILSVLKLI